MTTDGETRPNSKVARIIAERELDGMGDTLERKWLGEDGDRTSLRDLADEFNRAVLKAVLRDAGSAVSDHDVETTYRVLTESDISQADSLRKERELERTGVDVDDLERDFVTHQAIHTYLTEYREAELSDQAPDPDRKIETLERLEGRTTAVSESTLESLVQTDQVTDREYELFVEIRTVCEECGSDYALVDLISQGGCHCDAA